MYEFRCTRKATATDQGYYIEASSEEEAIAKMATKFPDEVSIGFVAEVWKDLSPVPTPSKPQQGISNSGAVFKPKIAPNKLVANLGLDEARKNQALSILQLFIDLNISIKKGKMRNDIKQWILTDPDGNKAGLYLGSGFGWALDGVKPNQELKGFFDMDFETFLVDNDIDFE